MPRIRFDGERDRVYEHARFGKLVDLIITDERQYRNQQPCDDAQLVICPDQQNPNRTMLGIQQKSWFKQTLATSPQTWKLWANEVMLMGFQQAPQNGANNDQWDGYAAERRELLEFVLANNVKNLLPVTGDIHNFFVGTATTDGSDTGTPVCGEFVGGSTTSRGLPEETGIPLGRDQGADQRPGQAHQLHGARQPRLRDPRGDSTARRPASSSGCRPRPATGARRPAWASSSWPAARRLRSRSRRPLPQLLRLAGFSPVGNI